MPQSTWTKSGTTYEVGDGLMQAVTTIDATNTETEMLELLADGRTWFEVIGGSDSISLEYTTKRRPSSSDLVQYYREDGTPLTILNNYSNAFRRTVTAIKFSFNDTPSGSAKIIVTQEKVR